MRKTLLGAAMELMQEGNIPSVSDVAEHAEVSRATAYRYFPSQASMIQEAVVEALGPIVEWSSDLDDAADRVEDLLASSLPRIAQYEATHRGALWLAIDQWSRAHAGKFDKEERVVRGSRIRLLTEALEPLRDTLDNDDFDKLTKAISLVFGIEAIVVLKDIWGLDDEGVRDTVLWAARSLVEQAVARAAQTQVERKTAHQAGKH